VIARSLVATGWFTLVTACASGPPAPVAIDTQNDACHHCRMIASDVHLASQIVAPGDEPLIFDDLGCLRDYLASSPPASDAVVYVADHRTGHWVPADRAVYTRVATLSTPMGSHLVAHADAASRDADAVTRGGEPVSARSIVGPRADQESIP
jgi:copper chaperone NosL